MYTHVLFSVLMYYDDELSDHHDSLKVLKVIFSLTTIKMCKRTINVFENVFVLAKLFQFRAKRAVYVTAYLASIKVGIIPSKQTQNHSFTRTYHQF